MIGTKLRNVNSGYAKPVDVLCVSRTEHQQVCSTAPDAVPQNLLNPN